MDSRLVTHGSRAMARLYWCEAVGSVMETRGLSKLLFNAQHRIAVAHVMARSDAVMGYEEVAERSGTSRSVAHKELRILVEIGAVNRLEVGRLVGYQRADSPFWPFLEDLVRRAKAPRPGQASPPGLPERAGG